MAVSVPLLYEGRIWGTEMVGVLYGAAVGLFEAQWLLLGQLNAPSGLVGRKPALLRNADGLSRIVRAIFRIGAHSDVSRGRRLMRYRIPFVIE